ncbi:hypothetical protein TNCV_4026381 [Trichonephila clavipes]|nr:hypothetical protein TNCV_4026381 [Trichonephila clavipes]
MASQCPSKLSIPRFPWMAAILSDLHHRESCWAKFQAQRFLVQKPRECPSSSGTPPVTQECVRGIPALLREGQVSSAGSRQQGLNGGQRSGATEN